LKKAIPDLVFADPAEMETSLIIHSLLQYPAKAQKFSELGKSITGNAD